MMMLSETRHLPSLGLQDDHAFQDVKFLAEVSDLYFDASSVSSECTAIQKFNSTYISSLQINMASTTKHQPRKHMIQLAF